jgi:predicted Zn-dependent protease with MMP-like domain
LPDRIYLYKKNLEAICHNREELKDQIRRTVLHEIGHYFGIDDKRLRELGY